MVETIAPVVYGRKRDYLIGVIVHALAATLSGAAFGALLGTIGMGLGAPWGEAGLWLVAAIGTVYIARELLGVPVPLFDRKKQVPDWWRTFFPRWIAAALYGAGLGIGFLTFLGFGTYVVVSVTALVAGSPSVGALLGGLFGLARGSTSLAAARTKDEEGAAQVVFRLGSLASSRGPRAINGFAIACLTVTVFLTVGFADEPAPRDRDSAAPARSLGVYGRPELVGRISVPGLTESSGLVASRNHPGWFWTHNDSGDDAAIYCITEVGDSCGRWSVTGASALDWEAVAAGPGPGGDGNHLYIGDIGDNDVERELITVYRVPEPEPGRSGATSPATAIKLRFPRAPHDAEALIVHPVSGTIYVFTKDLSGTTAVFEGLPGAGETTFLRKVATLRLDALGGVTAADITAAADRVILATYASGYEFLLPAAAVDFNEIWSVTPRRVRLGTRLQGEAIAYSLDGTSIFTTSEGRRSPLHRISLGD